MTSVIHTNPCAELWLLLHFQDQNAVMDRHEVQRKPSRTSPNFDQMRGKAAKDRACGKRVKDSRWYEQHGVP
jgi:hypothetical protein